MTLDKSHALFHLNAASPAARNTKQVNITKNLVHGRIRTTNTARPPDYIFVQVHGYNHSAATRVYEMN